MIYFYVRFAAWREQVWTRRREMHIAAAEDAEHHIGIWRLRFLRASEWCAKYHGEFG